MQSMVEGAWADTEHPLRRLRRHLPREERGRMQVAGYARPVPPVAP